MRMRCLAAVVAIALVALSAAAGEATWYQAPSLGIMTGFLKDPQGPLTQLVWRRNLGSRLDAERWVADFKAAGASYLIFYDKWHDGLVFHDTKTTAYKTRRDFVKEVAAACQKGGLRLILYTNPHIDGNPEFRQWAARNERKWFILMSERWPFEAQSLHSPFRQAMVGQVRELLTGYGRIDGLWLDIFRQPLAARNDCVAQAFEKVVGKRLSRATPEQLQRFEAATLAGFLDDVRAVARARQPGCVVTANGSALRLVGGGHWAAQVGARLDYGSAEGHQFDRIDGLARLASLSPKPVEIGILLCKTWFTRNDDAAPPAAKTPRQAVADVAVAACQGASVYLALTPGHAGTFGDDLKAAQAAGAWFRKAQPVLAGAEPVADVAVVLGTPAAEGAGLPPNAVGEAAAISVGLGRAGLLAQLLTSANWPASLAACRAVVVPDAAVLDDAHAEQIAKYVDAGGKLVVFGHGSMLDERGRRRRNYALADTLGVRYRDDASLEAAAWKVTAEADSTWGGKQFPAHLVLDGKSTFWASAETPMPHWVQVNFPAEAVVAKVELVSRAGGYMVADLDVQVPKGKAWQAVGSVRGAKASTISVTLDAPVETAKVRFHITRELVGGKNRIIADVEAVRIFDAAGRNLATEQQMRIAVLAKADAVKQALAGVTVAPEAVRVRERGAEVLAALDSRGSPAALLRHQAGKGTAWLVTASGTAVGPEPRFWSGLAALLGAKPSLRCSDPARYRVVLNRVAGGHVVHAIDRRANAKPADVAITLDRARLGSPKAATVVGSGAAVPLEQADGELTLTLKPDPVASVLLK